MRNGAKYLVYVCKCGRIRKYGKWKFPDNLEWDEIKRNYSEIEKIPCKCPMCKVAKK